MNNTEFMKELASILKTSHLGPELNLNDENWDSLAVLSTIALIDEQFNLRVSAKALQTCTSVADVLRLIHGAANPIEH